MKRLNLTGQTFNRLTVISEAIIIKEKTEPSNYNKLSGQ